MDRQSVYEQLKIDEGVVYEIYKDHLGYPTFGVGHLVLESDTEHGAEVGTPVSDDRVRECFERDLDTSISECVALYGEQFNDWPGEVQEILVNMMFNMGRTRLGKFKNFRKALEAQDWKQASIEGKDSLWYRQVTNRADRLMERLSNVGQDSSKGST
jgi:GH24 family phage-related lysozyme (muramidase)